MYLKQQKRSNGNIYLSIMEKYYVPKIGASEKTIESLGCISELKKKYDDFYKQNLIVTFLSERSFMHIQFCYF